MSNLLIKLINLPPTLRKLTALSIAGIAMILLVGLAGIGLSYVEDVEKKVMDSRQKLGIQRASVKQLGAIDFSESKDLAQKVFLGKSDEGILLASLQSKITELSNIHGIAVNSIGTASSYNKNNIQYVGISIVLTGSVAQIHNTLLAIESVSPALIVKTARISSLAPPPGIKIVTETIITAQLSVYGAVDPQKEDDT